VGTAKKNANGWHKPHASGIKESPSLISFAKDIHKENEEHLHPLLPSFVIAPLPWVYSTSRCVKVSLIADQQLV
jgi:hypothetical protein